MNKKKVILQLFKWRTCWAELADALIGIFTFGYVRIGFSYKSVLASCHWQAGWAAEHEKDKRLASVGRSHD